MLTHLSLFSGIEGIGIAAEWAGFKTICFVEINAFCQKVLRKYWPDVPLIEDIRNVTKEKVMAYTNGSRITQSGIQQSGVSTESSQGTTPRSRTNRQPAVDLITGGFPCQPFSVAGKQRGQADDRYLWPEMLRVIQELKPTWVCGENVAGILHMGIGTVLSDLERAGYQLQTFVIPACAVNAPHRRDRVFIVAYSERNGLAGSEGRGSVIKAETEEPSGQNNTLHAERTGRLAGAGTDVADTQSERIQGEWPSGEQEPQTHERTGLSLRGCEPNGNQWAVEPDVGRVANGVPARVDRLKALGNAVVPQQIYPVLKAIAETYQTRQ